MTNKEVIIEELKNKNEINSAHYLLGRIILSNVFQELSERISATGYEVIKFAEYLEKEGELKNETI